MTDINFIKIILHNESIIIKWYSDEIDHVAQKNGRVINYPPSNKIDLIYNINDIININCIQTTIQSSFLIDLINLLEDINGKLQEINEDIYDELFHKCCLPSITDEKEYLPNISDDDFQALKEFLIIKYKQIIDMSLSNLKIAQQGDAPEPDSCRSCLSETTSRPGDL
jgi:hypothetical protein